MLKMLGSHKSGKGREMAVLECGHEVEWNSLKWKGGEAEADCQKGCTGKKVPEGHSEQ